MKIKLRRTVLLVMVSLATACTPSPKGNPTPAVTAFIPNTGSSATEAIPEANTPTAQPPLVKSTATETQTATLTPTLIASPDETLMINSEGPVLYLVDDQGRSLYIYMMDEQHSGVSACIDDCAVEWPPLTVSTMPAAGAGVDESRLGTLSRAGGSTQATYHGWPLYYYNMDTIPGTTNGPSYDGLWFLLSPEGRPVR